MKSGFLVAILCVCCLNNNSLGTVNKGSVWSFTADAGQIITDRRFQSPMKILATPEGQNVVIGTLSWKASNSIPSWSIAQWNSTDKFLTRTVTNLADGSVRVADTKKSLTFTPAGSDNAESDLIMAYNSNGEAYSPSWPQLFVQQSIVDANGQFPKISQLSQLQYHIELKLIRDITTSDVAQFLQYFIIQDRNTASNNYGKYYWFGILFYDNRETALYQTTVPYYQFDAGTGMMLCQMPQNRFASGEINAGNWVTYNGDILPQIINAFNHFQSTGSIPATSRISDYCITSTNIGWEIPGHHDASMQLRNMSVRAVYP